MNKDRKESTIQANSYWNWPLYGSILLYFVLPSIYESYRLFLIGNTIPNPSALAIVSQWQFVQVGFEIIQEALVLPIFFFIGSVLRADKELIFDRLRTVLILLIICVAPLALGLQFFLPQFVSAINLEISITEETIAFLSIRIWGIILGLSSACFIAFLESLNLSKSIFLLALIKIACTFGLDSYFFGAYDFSLGLGVVGLAWSQLFIDLIILITSFIAVLNFGKIRFSEFIRGPWLKDVRIFLKLGAWSGLESFIRNIAYLTMVLSLLNQISQDAIAGYYLVMHLFWSLGLVPILAAGETTKALIANHMDTKEAILQILKTAFLIGMISIAIWILATLFLSQALGFFQSNKEVLSFAERSFYWLLLPYCLLAFNFILDAFLYGAGKTRYMALQAIFTHLIVYLPAFLLYQGEIWQPGFTGIMLLIGGAIVLDTVLTLWYVRKTFTKFNV